MGTILAPFMTRPMASAVYDIPNIECRTTSVVTNTTPITAYRGAGRPEATAAAERIMDMFAAEIGMDPVERPPQEPHRPVQRAAHHRRRADLRRRRLRRRAGQGARGRRLRRAAQAAGRAARRRREQAARHRRQRVRRDHRRRAAVRRARQDRGARRRPGHRLHRHLTARPGSHHLVEHAGPRADRHPDGPDRRRLGRHRPRARPAPARWARARCSRAARPCTRPPASWSTRPRSSPPSCSRPTRPTSSWTRTTAAFHVAGTPAVAKIVGRPGPGGQGRARPARGPGPRHVLPGRRGDVPVRRARRRGRGRHRDRRGPPHPPRRLRRRRPGAQPAAARGPDPRRHRPGRGPGAARRGALRRRRQPDHVEPRRLRVHHRRWSCRASRSCTWRRRRS